MDWMLMRAMALDPTRLNGKAVLAEGGAALPRIGLTAEQAEALGLRRMLNLVRRHRVWRAAP